MKGFIFKKQWGWLASGLSLGFIFLLAVAFVKPVGVSTQFVILDGIVWNAVSSDLIVEDKTAKKGYRSTNAYLNKSGGKYAKSVAKPINYSFIFVLAMILGGFVASKLQPKQTDEEKLESKKLAISPKVFRESLGNCTKKRYMISFIGGFLVLYGARLAGGCTSGHMMSGMMQTSLSGYLFAAGAFAVAIPVAIIMYKKRG